MSKYQYLLFDADGTLFDYDKAEGNALEKTFLDAGYSINSEIIQAYRKINAQLWLDFENGTVTQGQLRTKRFQLLFEALDINGDAKSFADRYLINLGNRVDLIDGAEEIIKWLNSSYQLQLVTNGIPDVQRSRIKQSPFKDLFQSIIISGEIGVAKPDGRFFDFAFSALNYPAKDEVIIIGDSLTSDVLGGLNYGIATCWFNPTGRPVNPKINPDYTIQNLKDLLTILNGEN